MIKSMANEGKAMARRSDHSREELEELALRTARKIVESEGAQTLTARRLAGDIGYTPGTLYHLFGSMDGVIYRINAETLEKIKEEIAPLHKRKPAQDIPADIHKMAAAYINFAHTHRELWLLLFNTQSAEQPPAWYVEKIEESFSPLEEVMKPLYKKESELKLAARALWSAIHGICYLEITQKGPMRKSRQNATEMAKYLITSFLNGQDRAKG